VHSLRSLCTEPARDAFVLYYELSAIYRDDYVEKLHSYGFRSCDPQTAQLRAANLVGRNDLKHARSPALAAVEQ